MAVVFLIGQAIEAFAVAPPSASFLSYELVEVNSIQGFNTYRVYLNVDNPTTELVSIFGVVDSGSNTPLEISSVGSFFQAGLGGLMASDINPVLFPFLPELEYDSWLTIGVEPGAGTLYTIGIPNGSFDEDGLVINDIIGGLVYTIPGLLPEAIAGADQKILIGQFTISGTASLLLNLQVMYEGQSTNINGIQLTFPDAFIGCNDAAACNYDPLATNDPSLCTFPTCNIPAACNYDPSGACFDEDICILPDGCTNPIACNYAASAVCDDGSCILPDGCTDPAAVNYNDAALCDDGTCNYTVLGCTDTTACNFNALANQDDGSCTFPMPNFDCAGNCLSFDECGNCGGSAYAGCNDPLACNYDSGAGCDDGSCIYANPTINGCTDALAANYMPAANTDDGSCFYVGCTDSNADNYNSQALYDDGSCQINGNPLVYGCTQTEALNFNPAANVNEGCVLAPPVPGCTNLSAVNYMPAATVDDGSCTFDTTGDCPADINKDGVINSTDLTLFLAVFGTVCD